LLDIGHTQLKVLRDPRQLKVHLGASSFGILGCSYSGRAAEVLDGLAAVRAAGLEAALVSNNRAVNPEIVLPDLRQPRALQHIAFTVVIQRLLHSECPPKIANLDDDLPSMSGTARLLVRVPTSARIRSAISRLDPRPAVGRDASAAYASRVPSRGTAHTVIG